MPEYEHAFDDGPSRFRPRRRGARRRTLPVRPLLGVVGVGLLFVGAGRHPLSLGDRLAHDIGGTLLLLALLLPIGRRAVVGLLMLPACAGVLGRAAQVAGAGGAAHALYVTALVCIPLVPAVLLGGRAVKRRALPVAARRPEVARELLGELYPNRSVKEVVGNGNRDLFDPDLGATGRPAADQHIPRGEPAAFESAVSLPREAGGAYTVSWDGPLFAVAESAEPEPRDQPGDLQHGALDIPGLPAEVVWCRFPTSSDVGGRKVVGRVDCVYLLDDAGYALLVVRGASRFTEKPAELAKRAGMEFNAYFLYSDPERARRIDQLLFPRRRRCIVIK